MGKNNMVTDTLSRPHIHSVTSSAPGVDYTVLAQEQQTDTETPAYRTAVSGLRLEDVPVGPTAVRLLTNYLDSKAVERYGLFICRNKPHVHFMAGREQTKKIHTERGSSLLEGRIVSFKQTNSTNYVSESDIPPAPEIDRLNNKVKIPWGISTKKGNDEIHMSNETAKINKERNAGNDKKPAKILIAKLSVRSKTSAASFN
ncbi:uncharacterized protein LOC127571861 [Pristis pectinata]|uniref:uncharacterized protein LOC127571861 n=1 Tax=Pristis pectinata TaxID=685728 RepID=UPI00223D8684|nr:uncharacterized protein LOC127571861 [Pristis pectinata]